MAYNHNQVRGATHPASKLTTARVKSAREQFLKARKKGTEKGLIAKLARKYGVSSVSMMHAIYGETWAHVPGAVSRR